MTEITKYTKWLNDKGYIAVYHDVVAEYLNEDITPTIKEYTKEQYPTLEHIEDVIPDNAGAYGDDCNDWEGYEETFTYDGKTYKALLEHDGTYMEYGIKGKEVTITQL